MEPQALPAEEPRPAADAEPKPAAGTKKKRARAEGADDAAPAKSKAAKAAVDKPDGGGSAAPAVGKAAKGKAAKAAAPKPEVPPAQVRAGSGALPCYGIPSGPAHAPDLSRSSVSNPGLKQRTKTGHTSRPAGRHVLQPTCVRWPADVGWPRRWARGARRRRRQCGTARLASATRQPPTS